MDWRTGVLTGSPSAAGDILLNLEWETRAALFSLYDFKRLSATKRLDVTFPAGVCNLVPPISNTGFAVRYELLLECAVEECPEDPVPGNPTCKLRAAGALPGRDDTPNSATHSVFLVFELVARKSKSAKSGTSASGELLFSEPAFLNIILAGEIKLLSPF